MCFLTFQYIAIISNSVFNYYSIFKYYVANQIKYLEPYISMLVLLIKFIEDISAEQFYSASAHYNIITALHPLSKEMHAPIAQCAVCS